MEYCCRRANFRPFWKPKELRRTDLKAWTRMIFIGVFQRKHLSLKEKPYIYSDERKVSFQNSVMKRLGHKRLTATEG